MKLVIMWLIYIFTVLSIFSLGVLWQELIGAHLQSLAKRVCHEWQGQVSFDVVSLYPWWLVFIQEQVAKLIQLLLHTFLWNKDTFIFGYHRGTHAMWLVNVVNSNILGICPILGWTNSEFRYFWTVVANVSDEYSS